MYVLGLIFPTEIDLFCLDSRIRQIIAHFIHPPTPIPSPSIEPVDDSLVPPPQEFIDEPAVVISAAPHVTTTGSFHFMLESELDAPTGLDIQGAEIPPSGQGLTFGSQDPTSAWEQVEAPVHPTQNTEAFSDGIESFVEQEQELLQSQQLQEATVEVSITEVCWLYLLLSPVSKCSPLFNSDRSGDRKHRSPDF